MPDNTFGTDFPTPPGWSIESDGDGPQNVCSLPCARVVMHRCVERKLARLYPA